MLTETWLKANAGKAREKQIEKADRDAMSVRVTPKGRITFQLRYRIGGKGARIDLGTYPALSLKDAREKALQYRAMIEQGRDPRIESRLADNTDSTTFQQMFDEWSTKYLYKNKKQAKEIYRSFELHIFDKLGGMPVNRLTVQHWLAALEPLAIDRPFIADRILNNGVQAYNWAVRRELCVRNPLQMIDAKVDLGIEHIPKDRNLNDDEIAAVWRAMHRCQMLTRNRLFVQLCFIYGCRSGELRIVKKSHIRRDEGIWYIPPENHKNGPKTSKPLIRPLIPETLAMFDLLATLSDCEYLIESNATKGQPISRGSLLSIPYYLTDFLEKRENMKIEHWSLHDIRRTVRTNLAKITEPHIAEIMLGHALPKIWRTYDQHDYLDEQRQALEKWVKRLKEIIAPYPLP